MRWTGSVSVRPWRPWSLPALHWSRWLRRQSPRSGWTTGRSITASRTISLPSRRHMAASSTRSRAPARRRGSSSSAHRWESRRSISPPRSRTMEAGPSSAPYLWPANRRRRHKVEADGLGVLVDIRDGAALDTLKHLGGEVDLLLIDGAFSLFLPVLKLVEPWLKPGAVVLGENAFEPEYLDYVRNPANG